jgi:hypothetical protein
MPSATAGSQADSGAYLPADMETLRVDFNGPGEFCCLAGKGSLNNNYPFWNAVHPA